jgi:hypothetical protein
VTDLLTAAAALDIARRTGRFPARHETRRDELRITARTGCAVGPTVGADLSLDRRKE